VGFAPPLLLRENLDVLFARAQKIQEIQSLVLAGLANAEKHEILPSRWEVESQETTTPCRSNPRHCAGQDGAYVDEQKLRNSDSDIPIGIERASLGLKFLSSLS
jgi:hypothetical protein